MQRNQKNNLVYELDICQRDILQRNQIEILERKNLLNKIDDIFEIFSNRLDKEE